MSDHECIVVHKFGEETGLPLQQATCSCGWQARVWYAGFSRISESYSRHIEALGNPEAPPWMLAPEVGK